MSDEDVALNDIPEGPDWEPPEKIDGGPVDRLRREAPPTVQESQEITQSLERDARRVESSDIEDVLSSEHARQLLEDDLEALYDGALDTNNPPDSITAFEQRVTLRNLAETAATFGASAKVEFEHRAVRFDCDENTEITSEFDSFAELRSSLSEARDPERAKKAIDRMVEYGQVSEQFIAMVAKTESTAPEIASYALDALADIQEQPTEQQSLVETLRQWWGGE